MNIEMINNHKSNMTSDIDKNTYGNLSSSNSRMRTEEMGFSLDITGKVTENAAYGKEDLKSAEEVMQTAAVQDVTVQRNYMAVMSNSMSDEDFANLMEEGANPLNTDLSESVTNLDKIKIKMAESGNVIEGFNDDLSDEDIKAVLGSSFSANSVCRKVLQDANLPDTPENIEGIKETVAVAENLKPLSEEAVTYILDENLEPTVENLYKAEFSASSAIRAGHGVRYNGVATYAGNNLDETNWESIKEQALTIVRQSGCTDEEEGLLDAKWLVSHDVPLTKETLDSFRELKDVILPAKPNTLFNAIVTAIEDGKSPVKANLLETESLYKKAVEIKDLFDNMSDNGDISKHRKLEEVRLVMTCEANYKLLSKGVAIETRPLEKLVEELKEAERDFYRPILGDKINDKENDDTSSLNVNSKVAENQILDERISLYKNTLRVMKAIPEIPLRAVADTLLSSGENPDGFTPESLERVGSRLKTAYEKAGESYEALMTAPRSDMGDSIKKAFRNVDEILTSLDMELNDTNRKAVRTLGYAGMMINKESVENIRQATMSVERVVSMMTPAKTLSVIRSGINPLSENIFELEKELSEETFEESNEKYSHFIWKLERRGEVTENEKDAFIGMYRLFDKIEKMDGKVIGNVLSNGQELTLENMLKAVRSNQHKNMDVKIDDDFGALQELVTKGESITDQIEKGFIQIINEKPQKDYLNEKMKNIRAAAKDSDEAVNLLTILGEPVTIENIAAVNDMASGMGKSFKRLFNNQSDKDDKEDRLDEADADELLESLTDVSATEKAYEKYIFKAESIARQRAQSAETYEDVRAYSMMYKQIGFASTLSKGQSYEVPIYTKEGWTSVHVSFKASEGSAPSVTAEFDTEEYGNVKGSFTIKQGGVDGFIVTSSRDGAELVKSREEKIRDELTKVGLDTANLSVVFSRNNNDKDYFNDSLNVKVTNEELYSVAKAFIKAMGERK